MSKVTGKVKMFNNEKGFGFINIEGEERDIFFHYSQIIQDGFKSVDSDQMVTFDLLEGEKGLQARNVEKI